jgi:hypothetical protein
MQRPRGCPAKANIGYVWWSILLRYGLGALVNMQGETRVWEKTFGLVVRRTNPPKIPQGKNQKPGLDKYGVPIGRDEFETLENSQLANASYSVDYDPIVDFFRKILGIIPFRGFLGIELPTWAGTLVISYQYDYVVIDGIKDPEAVASKLRWWARNSVEGYHNYIAEERAHMQGQINTHYMKRVMGTVTKEAFLAAWEEIWAQQQRAQQSSRGGRSAQPQHGGRRLGSGKRRR